MKAETISLLKEVFEDIDTLLFWKCGGNGSSEYRRMSNSIKRLKEQLCNERENEE